MIARTCIKVGCLCLLTLEMPRLSAEQSQVAQTQIQGSGSAVVSSWLNAAQVEYEKKNPLVNIKLEIANSDAALQQVMNRESDFAYVDASIPSVQSRVAERPLQWIPIGGVGVGIAFHLDGFQGPFILDAEALTNIYEGKITKWNDSSLQKLNEQTLPDKPIYLVVPSNTSNYTQILSSFLSHNSDHWKSAVGAGLKVNWPVGQRVKASDLSATIREQDGSLGCTEIRFAKSNNLPVALLKMARESEPVGGTKEAMGKTISASIKEGRVILDPTGIVVDGGYPLVSIASVVLQADTQDAEAVKTFVRWFLDEADTQAEPLGCISLPAEIKRTLIKSLTGN